MRQTKLLETSLETVSATALQSNGRERMFEDYISRHHAKLTRLAHSLVGPDHALDLVQTTYLKAWRARNDYRGDSSFSTWMYRIATNAANDFRKKKGREMEDQLSEDYSVVDDAQNLEASIHKKYVRGEVQACIAQLKPRYKRIILLREFEELSYGDIASILDIPIGTVRSSLHKARRELRQELEPRGCGKGFTYA